MRSIEPAILPRWRAKKPVKPVETKTQYMRSNFNRKDVLLPQWILASPASITVLAAYRSSHQRELKPERLTADPDIPRSDWRSRPERHLTARQLMEQQLSGKALVKELKRLR